MATANRRIEARAPACFRVDYIHEDDYIISFNKNISVDGMFICTDQLLPVGTHLRLVFTIGGFGFEEVSVAAIVVWVNATGRARDKGMGVQFLSPLTPLLKESIVRMVDRVAVLEKDTRIPT